MAGWYRRSPSDFIAGTMRMTLEEKGAYSLVLDLIYDRGAPIEDDARFIAGVCGCSVRKWLSIRDRLISLGKIVVTDGRIANRRAAAEIERAKKIAAQNAENGSKGGAPKGSRRASASVSHNLSRNYLVEKSSRREDKIDEKHGASSNNNDLEKRPPLYARAQDKEEDKNRDSLTSELKARAAERDRWLPPIVERLGLSKDPKLWPRRWIGLGNRVEQWIGEKRDLFRDVLPACAALAERGGVEDKGPNYLDAIVASQADRHRLAPATPAVLHQSERDKRRDAWRRLKLWAPAWGPKPGEPGCCLTDDDLMEAA